jgi:DMSO/TMAO reductase YedYZ molybdopterin-dependent catalytic subunit
MSRIHKPDRRGFLKGGLSLGALSLLTGCDLTDNKPAQQLLWNMSYWNDRVQGWLFNPNRLAPTYPESAVDRVFRYNAFYPEEQAPQLDPTTYRLELSGSIGDKRSWTVDNLYQLPRTSQITRHVCVEGWSRIGKWSGCPLRIFLEHVEADLTKNYVGFICADGYYTSIDMPTALHPQTITAFTFADRILPRKFGYPMKIRIPTRNSSLPCRSRMIIRAASGRITGTIGSAAPKGVLRPSGSRHVGRAMCRRDHGQGVACRKRQDPACPPAEL